MHLHDDFFRALLIPREEKKNRHRKSGKNEGGGRGRRILLTDAFARQDTHVTTQCTRRNLHFTSEYKYKKKEGGGEKHNTEHHKIDELIENYSPILGRWSRAIIILDGFLECVFSRAAYTAVAVLEYDRRAISRARTGNDVTRCLRTDNAAATTTRTHTNTHKSTGKAKNAYTNGTEDATKKKKKKGPDPRDGYGVFSARVENALHGDNDGRYFTCGLGRTCTLTTGENPHCTTHSTRLIADRAPSDGTGGGDG